MRKICMKVLVVLCAAIAVISFIRPNLTVILVNFAVVMFLYKKGWLKKSTE